MQSSKAEVDADCMTKLRSYVNGRMNVLDPIYVSNRNGDGNVKKVFNALNTIFEDSMHKPEMLKVIQTLCAEKLILAVRAWSAKACNVGLETHFTLNRRCAMAIARSHGARWDEFHEQVSDADLKGVCSALENWTHPGSHSRRNEDLYHQDHKRKMKAKLVTQATLCVPDCVKRRDSHSSDATRATASDMPSLMPEGSGV
eukprot:TRINITY_DN33454_c0_g1_i1.p1 TRINITY_DN33454_c0_g1~~TRINITY_DN33454_c0_g1_i1.p1  ORF type:complete len:200 (-),score=7.21 TRINITY_DN33454_c0_g1_i1:207-806(-)